MVPKSALHSMHYLVLHQSCWNPSEVAVLRLTSLGLRYLNHNDCLGVVTAPMMGVTSIGAMTLLNHNDDVDAVGKDPADVTDELGKTNGHPDSAYAAESAGNIHGDAETQMATLLPVSALLRTVSTWVYRTSAELEVVLLQVRAIEMLKNTLREAFHGQLPSLLLLLLLLHR